MGLNDEGVCCDCCGCFDGFPDVELNALSRAAEKRGEVGWGLCDGVEGEGVAIVVLGSI